MSLTSVAMSAAPKGTLMMLLKPLSVMDSDPFLV